MFGILFCFNLISMTRRSLPRADRHILIWTLLSPSFSSLQLSVDDNDDTLFPLAVVLVNRKAVQK